MIEIKKLGNKGVSETVGFIIILGIVMTGIGLVTLYGYPAILSEQSNANIKNMEKDMIILQSDVNSLTFKNVPYSETTMQVSGGTLTIENPTDKKKFKISTENYGDIPLDFGTDVNFQPGEIQYKSDSEQVMIGLQNGAVVKNQNGGSTMISEPRWYFDQTVSGQHTLVIILTQISSLPMSNSGVSTIKMRVEKLPMIEIPSPGNPSPGDVTVTYTDLETDYYTGWKNYFSNFDPTLTGSSPPNVKMTIEGSDVDQLIIKQYKIEIVSL